MIIIAEVIYRLVESTLQTVLPTQRGSDKYPSLHGTSRLREAVLVMTPRGPPIEEPASEPALQ